MAEESSQPPSSLQDVIARLEKALSENTNDRLHLLEQGFKMLTNDCIRKSMFKPYLKLGWAVISAATVPAGAALYDFVKNHIH